MTTISSINPMAGSPPHVWPSPIEAVQQAYNHDGFVVLKSFLVGDELRQLQHEIQAYFRDTVPHLPPMDVFYQEKGNPASITMLARISQHSRYFEAMLQDSPFSRLANSLLPGGAVPQNVEFFDKPAGTSHTTPPHQDGYYFHLHPCEAVTLWLALDTIDESNGCMRYVPGSHRQGMRHHAKTSVLGFSQGIPGYDGEDRSREVPVHSEPGDLLVHDALTIHRADPNATPNRARRAIAFVYFSQRAVVDRHVAQEYQQQLEREWKTQGRI